MRGSDAGKTLYFRSCIREKVTGKTMKKETDDHPSTPWWMMLFFGAVLVLAILGTLAWYLLTHGRPPGQ
jgi:hypothetical protein